MKGRKESVSNDFKSMTEGREGKVIQRYILLTAQVDSWLKKEETGGGERVQEVKRKLEEAYHDNRTLNMTLHETTANLGLMRSDLAQMRLQYEEKCRELHR